MDSERPTGPILSDQYEIIDAAELAARLRVPPSWVRNRTRATTPKDGPIPHVRLGRYVRFLWASPELRGWLERQMRR